MLVLEPYSRTSGCCCLSRASAWSSSASSTVFALKPSWISAAANASRWSSSIAMWPFQRSSQSAFELVGVSLILSVS